MYVPGLKLEEVKDMGEVTAMIGRGKANRSTYATNMNEHSSRSHLVLSVYITAVSKQNGESGPALECEWKRLPLRQWTAGEG